MVWRILKLISACVVPGILSGCMAFPGMSQPDYCDALPLSTVYFQYPAVQARAQFDACTATDNQPLIGLLSCPMLPVSPVLTAFFTIPLIPVAGVPIDLLSKLSPYTTCKPTSSEVKSSAFPH